MMNKKQVKLKTIIMAVMLFVGVSLFLITGGNAGNSSDFEIESYSSYSNAIGNRYCRISVKNIKSGGRIINSTDFMAILANGTEVRGEIGNNIHVNPGETEMIRVDFGQHKWPVEKVNIY
jgi:hypothetical protein